MATHYQHQPGVPEGQQQYFQAPEVDYTRPSTGGMEGTYATNPMHQQHYQSPQQYAQPVSSYAPTTATGTEHAAYYGNGSRPVTGAEKPLPPAGAGAGTRAPSSTIMGMKRAVFIALVAIVVLLLALVIGLGAGLGVSQRNLHNAQSDLAAAQSKLSASPTTKYVFPFPLLCPQQTLTAPSPTPTTSSTASPSPTFAKSGCPGNNGTTYTSTSNDNKQFKLLCGRDFGDGEANDIGSTNTATINGCMDACAAKSGCQGAGWGFIEGVSKEGKNPCYMKTNLTSSRKFPLL